MLARVPCPGFPGRNLVDDAPSFPEERLRGRFGGHFRGMGVCPPVQKGVRLGRIRPARQGRIHWAGRIECGCREVLESKTAAIAAVLCVVSSNPRYGVSCQLTTIRHITAAKPTSRDLIWLTRSSL